MEMDISQAFERMADAISANIPKSDSKYMGDDGFLHCSVCHKRTQTRIRIEFMGVHGG